MIYAKINLLVDADNKMIPDWDLVMSREHDSKITQRIFKRNTLKNISCLGDKGYGLESLHEIAVKMRLNFLL